MTGRSEYFTRWGSVSSVVEHDYKQPVDKPNNNGAAAAITGNYLHIMSQLMESAL